MSLSIVTPPADTALRVEDLREQCKVDDELDDAYFQRLIGVVTARAQRATRRALITQTWDLSLDQWPVQADGSLLPAGGWVELPKAPLQRIVSITYIDLAGVTQTWDPSNYLVDAPQGDYCRRGRLSLGWVKVWPIIRPIANAVTIRMDCGYGDGPEDVPDILLQAMLLDAGTLFEIRASILAGTRAVAIEIPSTSNDIYLSFRSL